MFCRESLERVRARLESGRLQVGDEICDMHYGVQSVPGVARVISHTAVFVDDANDTARRVLSAERSAGGILEEPLLQYTNKMLAVLKIDGDVVVGIYGYDHARFGVVVLRFAGLEKSDAGDR